MPAGQLEQKRQALVRRLDQLRPGVKASRGYRSARILLGSKYTRASVAARLGLLQAAEFLIRVLELIPPV